MADIPGASFIVKRKQVDKAIRQLLDRIDGELAEVRDGLIQVDHKAGEARAAYRARDAKMMEQAEQVAEITQRLNALETHNRSLLARLDDAHSRKVPS